MKKENKCTECTKNEWRYLFPCNVPGEAVREALTDRTSFDGSTQFDIDDEFLATRDYVTLVPVEIALDTETREKVRNLSPDTRFIVTGVHEADVERMLKLGYEIVDMTPYCKPEEPKTPSINPKEVLKNHSWAEIKEALDAYENLKPLFELLGEEGQNILRGWKQGTIKVSVE